MFLIGVDGLKNISLICRRRQNLSVEQEREILTPFLARARKGGILVVWQIKAELEAAIGRSMARSSVYQLLHRYGWRKPAPDKRHIQRDLLASGENSPRRSPN